MMDPHDEAESGCVKSSVEGSAKATSDPLYSLYFSAGGPHGADMWNVFGRGFGLRCFYTKAEAESAATAHFGTGRITLQLWPDRTSVHVQAAPIAEPAKVLDQAIAALQAERAALKNCPAHKDSLPSPFDLASRPNDQATDAKNPSESE